MAMTWSPARGSGMLKFTAQHRDFPAIATTICFLKPGSPLPSRSGVHDFSSLLLVGRMNGKNNFGTLYQSHHNGCPLSQITGQKDEGALVSGLQCL